MKHNQIIQNRSFQIIFASTYFAAVLAGCIFIGPRMLNMDGDLGRHLTVGAFILDSGKIPITDIFSHTMTGARFTPHEWISEVLFTVAYRLMGLSGVVLLTAFVLALTWYKLAEIVIRHSERFYMSLTMILIGIAASSIHWISRPHIFTYLFLLIWITVYHSSLHVWKKALFLFGIMILWVNTHGAFITGLVYIFVDLAGMIIARLFRQDYKVNGFHLRERGIVLGISAIGIFVNPVGYRILGTIINFLTSQYLTSHTVEYQAPSLVNIAFIPYYLLIILSIVLLIIRRKFVTPEDLVQITIWNLFALLSARNIPLAVVVTLPILSQLYGDILPQEGRIDPGAKPRLDLLRTITLAAPPLLLMGGAILALGLFPQLKARNAFSDNKFPVYAVNHLMQNPVSGNMFNEFTWGGYLLYRMWPEEKVFIDGQTDFYGENLTREYANVIDAKPGYEDILKKYDVNLIIVPPNSGIAKAIAGKNDWLVDYTDTTSVIYIRK